MVKYFLELGANVVITRSEELLIEVVNLTLHNLVFQLYDVRKIDEVEKNVIKSYKKFGKIDCLVNNAEIL